MSRVRMTAAALAVAVSMSLVTGQVPALAAVAHGPGPIANDKPVPVHAIPVQQGTPSVVDKRAIHRPATVSWPAGGAAEIALHAGPVSAEAGGLPVRVAPAARDHGSSPARLRMRILDRAATTRAGVTGVVLQLARTDGVAATGRVTVSIDYSGFRDAVGGDWASRLRLEQIPECGLATAARTDCQPKLLRTTNDARSSVVTAELDVAGTVSTFALTAGASGSTGNYTATSLSPSASWEVNAQSGDFGWSYSLKEPPVPGGLSPSLGLSYSSGSVDGRTASTNSQPSWVGEGWDLWSGFVERRYKPCVDDGVQTGDLCWGPESVSFAFGGRSGELVRDDATGAYHPRNDDGSKVEQLTGAVNGGTGGEYWRVTTIDGTQYYFGLNHLPGWASGKPATNSAWTVPVFGNNAGEPCHQSTFDASSCDQVYRWNLDYVVDPHGNAMAFYYGTESNLYGADMNKRGASYVRGGFLSKAVYGFRDGHAYDVTPPAAQVSFTTAERCITAGSTCVPTLANKTNFPDVPLDQLCTTAPCNTSQTSPTFWSTKKLSTITTGVWNGSTYSSVDSWALSHSFPNPGDGTSAALWLGSVVHTGLVGGSLADPPVQFDGNVEAMPNRVDGLEGWPPMNKYRIATIRTETGGQIEINYAAVNCDRAALPTAQDTNTARCFPQWWTPPGEPAAMDWFHKRVVGEIVERDLVGGNPAVETFYDYQGGAAWHYTDSDEITPVGKRTWSQWRGYGKVVVTKGAVGGTQSQNTYIYMRGMNGDKLSTGFRTASVTDTQGGALVDDPWLSGFLREHITSDGAGGPEVDGQIYDPWHSPATATHVHDGLTVASYLTRTHAESNRVALTSGGYRRTQVVRDFDSHGLVTRTEDRGDIAISDDDRCATTTYAANAARWMFSYPAESTNVAVNCSATPSYPDDAISQVRSYYDGSTTLGALPGGGDVTRTDQAVSYDGTTPQFVTITTGTYDVYGRARTSVDPLGRTTSTVYTETNGLTTQTTVTDPAGFATTTTFAPEWGQPTAAVDANLKRSDLSYDAQGRLVAVWKPSRPKAKGADAAVKFTYLIRNNGPAVVTTTTLEPNANYTSTYALYDGLLRPRQTQAPAEGGGRVLTDTIYDSRGLVEISNGPYSNTGAPGTTLVAPSSNEIPTQTVTDYDGAGRPVASIFQSRNVELWRSTTTYEGDRISVTPPEGGTATTTLFDARGRTTELRQYHQPMPTGAYDSTLYTYTNADQLASLTDPGGNTWRYTYDLRGRQTKVEDPDKGASTMTYDDASQLTTTTDARGRTLAYSYDALGRKTSEYENSLTGTQLAAWSYDTLLKGYPTSSTRYVNGNQYVKAIRAYNDDGQVRGTSITIPAGEGDLAGTYSDLLSYAPDGSLTVVNPPDTAGLPKETLTYVYDSLGNQTKLQSGLSTGTTDLVSSANYTSLGKLARVTLTDGPTTAFLSYAYEQSTQRLSQTTVEIGGIPTPTEDTHYSYDPTGNIKKINTSTQGGQSDTQCFSYDYLRRLTEAWTPTDDCAGAPGTAPLGGAAPYWNSYTYDAAGNRQSEVQHDTTGGTNDTTREYTYPDPGQPRPHAPTQVVTTADGVSATTAFGYDVAGNTISRPQNGNQQTLDWDAEGSLTSVTEAGQTTSFAYDADGNRLIRRDASGATLYLPSGVEVHVDTSGVKSSTRYYTFAGQTVAMRTSSGVFFLGADQNATVNQTIAATDGTVATRRFDPFGNPRGTPPETWPGERGFVGGITDPTGLTHLGAREYDPVAGRFISVDPVLDTADPQQLNGYAYANNSPVTMADATGQLVNCGPDGFRCGMDPYHDPKTGAPRNDNNNDKHDQRDDGGGADDSAGGYSDEQVQAAGVSASDYKKAVKNKKRDVKKVIVEIATAELKDFLGITDIMDCFTGGDILACVSMLLNAVPVYKLYKFGGLVKHLYKAWNAFQDFMKERRWANKIMHTVEAACPIGRSSFLPGTPVLMADGSRKPIEKIRPGDKVMATDPLTGRTQARVVVVALTSVGVKHLVRVTVDTDGSRGNGTGTVTATDTHPFWVQDPVLRAGPNLPPGRWTPAAELSPGALLRTPTGSLVAIISIATYTEVRRVHNLTVDTEHTYSVIAGSAPVLVHNKGDRLDRINLGQGYTARLDVVPGGGGDFELHVYYKGSEVGLYGSEGFFAKHGHSADVTVPQSVENRLKGQAVKYMRRAGRLGPKGTEDITGDKWKRPRIAKGSCG